MQHDQNTVTLDREPSSAARARALVAARLRELGRDDLVESGELVVSEIVTNALLHGEPPLALRFGGTAPHPRVEVWDGSREAPAVQPVSDSGDVWDAADDTYEPVTFGRGLYLVASYSASWGVDLLDDGKLVWFEPCPEPQQTPVLPRATGSVKGETLAGVVSVRAGRTFPVVFLGLPVRQVVAMRRHHDDVQREIRLIGLQHDPAAERLPSRLLEQARHPQRHRLRASGTDVLAQAILAAEEHVDVHYEVTGAGAEMLCSTIDLLYEADEFCRQERMLAADLSPSLRDFLGWYRAQVVTQVAGEDPVPWSDWPRRTPPGG